jgi:uncharacterized protein
MRIANQTRSTIIAASASEARSFTEKFLGLMGKANLPESSGLIIRDTNWIHTFWMRFPLDLIYITRERRVVGLEESLPPNRIGKPFWSAHSVVELNAGVIRATQTQVGDQLQFD